MNIGNILYFIKQALSSLKRNRLLSFATVSTVGISVLILGLALLVTINANHLMNSLESDVEIVAYLNNDLTTSQISDLKASIEKINGVGSFEFVTKESALRELQKSIGNKDLGIASGGNPLPNSYSIKAQDPHQVPDIAAQVKQLYGITKVNYGQGFVEKLFKVASWIRTVSIVLVALLACGAVFLIATTIRLAIFSRRKEIYLMKLVGATDWFIRWPFFIEGIILGITGAFIAVLVLGAGYGSLLNATQSMFFLPFISDSVFLLYIYVSLAGVGALMGIIGSYISLNRFLNV